MKKLSTVLVTTTVLLAGCASTTTYDAFTSVQLNSIMENFQQKGGALISPIEGKFKEVTAFKSSSVGSHGFTCSGTDTIKTITYMNIHADSDGSVKAKAAGSYCGDEFETVSYKGLQTNGHLYLYNTDKYEVQNLREITKYEIQNPSGVLIEKGSFRLENGSVEFIESRQNNETWSQGLGSNYSYRTTGLSPENLWSKVDHFERSIVVKHGGRAAGEFQWGKALALGVGAVAGGGLSVNSDTQAGVIAGIVLDSQADTSGTSNLDNAVQASIATNVNRAAANSVSEQDTTQNQTSLEVEPAAKHSVDPTLQTPNAVSTSNSPGNSKKCGVSSYSLAEEQAEKDRLRAIMQSKLANVPSYDYKTRNQAWRDWGAAMDDWRKARHEACGIDTNRTSRVTIE